MNEYYITDGETTWRILAANHDVAMLASYFHTVSKLPRRFIHRAPLTSRYSNFNGTMKDVELFGEATTRNFDDISFSIKNMWLVKFHNDSLKEGKFDPISEPKTLTPITTIEYD